ncbi:uncharacterized protein LOC143887664 [Tasmannia lanceolata]|uniref:uncharacterized protein LOC143887664 n=1 Tax=Tasmannia lanceolata TaxID=3420 RepID=UPI0040645E55
MEYRLQKVPISIQPTPEPMAESGNTLAEMNELMKSMLQQMNNMSEEIVRLKSDRGSTSEEPVPRQIPLIPPPHPAMARLAVLNVEDDVEDEQYAEDNCLPHLERANEGRAITDRLDKLTREMESIKFQGPKKLSMSDFMIVPGVVLPPKFTVPDLDKYDGTGCPTSHLKSVIPLLQQHGLSPEQIALVFPRSLVGTAKKWFLSLKSEEIRTLEDIANKFVEQFSMEEGIEVTKRDLKMLKQGHNETFTSFIRRWRRKAVRMTHRLSDEDQIKIVVKNLSPQYYHHMAIQYFLDFNHLIKTGTQVEDALAKGLKTRTSTDVRDGKRTMVAAEEVSNVETSRQPFKKVAQKRNKPIRKPGKEIPPLPKNFEKALRGLVEVGKLELPEPSSPPNPLPSNFYEQDFCEYHRVHGHSTNSCQALKHKILKLIKDGKVVVGEPGATKKPVQRSVGPLPMVGAISTDEPLLDPASLIRPISEMPPVPSSLRLMEESFERSALIRMENWMVKLFGQMAMLTEEVREMKTQIRYLSTGCDSAPKQFADMGTMTEETSVQSLILDRYVDLHSGTKPVFVPSEVQNVEPYRQPFKKPIIEVEERMGQRLRRECAQLPCSQEVIMKKWVSEGRLTLLDPKLIPNPLPKHWRRDQYCEYHRGIGHTTEKCLALKHKIQDEIDGDSSLLPELCAFMNYAPVRPIQPFKGSTTSVYAASKQRDEPKGKEKMSECEPPKNVRAESMMPPAGFQGQFGPGRQNCMGPPLPRFLYQDRNH